MKLLYTLNETQCKALDLGDGEKICYCVPVDLQFDNYTKMVEEAYAEMVWLVVTTSRFLVLEQEKVSASFLLADCEKIKCEHQVNSGIVTVTMKEKDDNPICAARFSMRHIIRVSYVTRGAQAIITSLQKGHTAKEAEKIYGTMRGVYRKAFADIAAYDIDSSDQSDITHDTKAIY